MSGQVMDGECVMRIRGTFIELCRPNVNADVKQRSSSAPPDRSPTSGEGPRPRASSGMDGNEDPTLGEGPPPAVASAHCRFTDPAVLSGDANAFEMSAVICSCGAAFEPNACCCTSCGSRKTDVDFGACHARTPSSGEMSNLATPDDFVTRSERSESWGGESLSSSATGTAQTTSGQSNSSTAPSGADSSPKTTAEKNRDNFNKCKAMSQRSTTTNKDKVAPARTMGGESDKSTASKGNTTMMLCEIPVRQTIEQIVAAIDMAGFANTYNLVYMPPQKGPPKHGSNKGFAFVNFKQPQYATAFEHVFQNFSFPESRSSKKSYAQPGHCQGFGSNLAIHKKNKSLGHLRTFL